MLVKLSLGNFMSASLLVPLLMLGALSGCTDDKPLSASDPESAADPASKLTISGHAVAGLAEVHRPSGPGDSTPLVASDYLGSYTLIDESFGTIVTVRVSNSIRSIQSNSLPNHETGDFPNDGNPNTISEQALSYEFSTEPIYIGNANFAQAPGVAVNGVAFEPGTGESVSCESGQNYRIEALQSMFNLGLDFNNAHVQPGGKYHYHGVSPLLIEAYKTDDDLVHVGFAADGFLMYYSKSGAYRSGYRLSANARSGSDCAATGPNNESFDLDGTAPDGTYGSDWVYIEGAGDLDSCNGISIDGQYVYIVTDEYPYIPRCLNGEFTQRGGPEGSAAGGGGAGEPDLSTAAATLGISQDELRAALGTPPPNLEAAAEILGVSVAELEAVLPTPDGAPGGAGPGAGGPPGSEG
jgi:hypothetical protein